MILKLYNICGKPEKGNLGKQINSSNLKFFKDYQILTKSPEVSILFLRIKRQRFQPMGGESDVLHEQ